DPAMAGAARGAGAARAGGDRDQPGGGAGRGVAAGQLRRAHGRADLAGPHRPAGTGPGRASRAQPRAQLVETVSRGSSWSWAASEPCLQIRADSRGSGSVESMARLPVGVVSTAPMRGSRPWSIRLNEV